MFGQNRCLRKNLKSRVTPTTPNSPHRTGAGGWGTCVQKIFRYHWRRTGATASDATLSAPLVVPLVKLNREFPYGEILHREIPYRESGATSKTGLALGFCGDSFSAGRGELSVVPEIASLFIFSSILQFESDSEIPNLNL